MIIVSAYRKVWWWWWGKAPYSPKWWCPKTKLTLTDFEKNGMRKSVSKNGEVVKVAKKAGNCCDFLIPGKEQSVMCWLWQRNGKNVREKMPKCNAVLNAIQDKSLVFLRGDWYEVWNKQKKSWFKGKWTNMKLRDGFHQKAIRFISRFKEKVRQGKKERRARPWGNNEIGGKGGGRWQITDSYIIFDFFSSKEEAWQLNQEKKVYCEERQFTLHQHTQIGFCGRCSESVLLNWGRSLRYKEGKLSEEEATRYFDCEASYFESYSPLVKKQPSMFNVKRRGKVKVSKVKGKMQKNQFIVVFWRYMFFSIYKKGMDVFMHYQLGWLGWMDAVPTFPLRSKRNMQFSDFVSAVGLFWEKWCCRWEWGWRSCACSRKRGWKFERKKTTKEEWTKMQFFISC